MVKALRILLLEDSRLDAELIEVNLREGGINSELVRVESRLDFVRAIEQEAFDLILADYSLPAFDGIRALQIARNICPEIPFILVSATLGEDLAIETLKNGATDYVLKQRLERLVPAVNRAMREAEERQQRQKAQEALAELALELEIRVEKRTAELAAANQALKAEIAQRQQVEESLRKSESTLRSYFELPLIGIAIISPDQKWLEVNDKLCDILGYERSQLIRKTWVELTYPEDLPQDLAEFNQLLAGVKDQYSLDKRFIRPDGRVIYASISVRCVRQKDGSVDYFVALVQDLTERKHAEEERLELIREQAARREAEEQGRRSAFLAEASTLLASSLDYESSLTGVAQLIVPYLADWCAVDIREIENQPMRRVAIAHIDPATVKLPTERLSDYPHTSDISESDLISIAQNQEHLHILKTLGLKSYMIVPLLARGRTLGAITLVLGNSRKPYDRADLSLVEDLARRAAWAIDNAQLYHETQKARAEAEAANRAKDEFLATLSHELRTPLNAVLGWTQLLRNRQLHEDKMNQALLSIERNTKSLATLIEDLLDVSRIMTGKLQIYPHPCDLTPVIEAAVEVLRPSAEAKMIQLNCDLDAAIGKVWGDANRLQQVVWNLVSNAIKFTPHGGQVTVRLGQIQEDLSSLPYAEIEVIDTGKGITPEFLPHVFDRFRQEDGSITKSHSGLGLGLAIVQYLVDMHQGTVQVSSLGEGLGATFTVRLPLWVGLTEPRPQSSLPSTVDSIALVNNSTALAGLQVLIVDDQADAREVLTTILEHCGAFVWAAASAMEGLEYFHSSRVDLIISDIAMPKMDGYEFIRQLRKLEGNRGTPIPAVALTAYASESDRTLALNAGFQVHLPKPFSSDQLVTILAGLKQIPSPSKA